MMSAMINRILWPPAGRYILAISGGADSMVLLEAFAAASTGRGYDLVVAHFDHGLRPESVADAAFVAAAAQSRGLPFEGHAAGLGASSEATARAARHTWLGQVRANYSAAAILTAHHQDDLARGSGRRGLAPMPAGGDIIRPLIQLTRADLRAYAAAHHIGWREDPTNADTSNPRNFLRHRLLPQAPPKWRERYLELVTELTRLNTEIDQSIGEYVASARTGPQTYSFNTTDLRALTPGILEEVILATAQRLVPGVQLDRQLVAQAADVARTGRTGNLRPLRKNIVLVLKKGTIAITTNPRQ
jgi:tRNA(Ile)-lysidine synthetase-like protein